MRRSIKDVSIVIVTYNGDDMTRNCLDSLSATCGEEPQIVVVDNSPSDATRCMVAAYPNAVYVPSPGNPGFAGGNNRALPYCDRPYILLLNNDTIIHTGESIGQMARFLEENTKCGVVQGSGRLPRVGGTLAGCGAYLTPLGFLWSTGFMESSCPRFDVAHPCFAIGGFFMMFRREDLPRFGGFLFRSEFWCYYEEIDFCHRVWLSGKEVWYLPTPPIEHLLSMTSGRFAWDSVMGRYLRNILFSLGANLSFCSRMLILPMIRAGIAAHALLCLVRGRWKMFRGEMSALGFSSRLRRLRLAAARRQSQRIRKKSDREIFKICMRMSPLSSFLARVK